MATEPLPGVSRTAIGVAAMRAAESGRPDRLFDDPHAQAFVDAARAELAEPPPTDDERRERSELGALFYTHAVVRTRFYDEYLLSATDAGCTQVVLLAAGLDSRAFRLRWPEHTRLFELDLPDLMAFKQRVLTERAARPTCRRTVVPVDLRTDWPSELLAAGFQPEVPTAWLAEGLLVYLSADEASALLESVLALSAPGSRLSFEHSDRTDSAGRSLLDRARALPGAQRWAALLKGGLGEHAPDWLAERGWRCEMQHRAELAARYGRAAGGTDDDPVGKAVRAVDDSAGGGFLTAVHAGS